MSDCPVPILALKPKQQPVVWGGHLLAARLNKPASQEPIGESWEVWEGDTVEAGPFAGQELRMLAERYPEQLMGRTPVARGWARFPLLTKFIDAHEPLSVQVHPTDEWAQKLENQPNGKTEAWRIISVEPGAWIIHGLTRKVDAPELRRRLEDGTADELLRKVPAVPGETIFVPAGTIHAIGPGVLLHEVQQTSDVTYRLYDWNRGGRELHLDKGLEVAWLDVSPSPVIEPLTWQEANLEISLIQASTYFTVKQVSFPGSIQLNTGARSFHIITVLSGDCTMAAGSERLDLKLGQSMVVPGCCGPYRLSSENKGQVLVEYIADDDGELRQELRDRGFDRSRIDTFFAQFGPARQSCGATELTSFRLSS